MNISVAIIAGALIIAVALAFSSRWQISTANYGDQAFVIRLDQWTGTATLCVPVTETINKYDCSAKYK